MAEENLPVKHAGGRPTKYKPEFVHEAYKLALIGAIDKQIAEYFEIDVDTLNQWKKIYPELSLSLKGGKLKADSEVAYGLYNRAIGAEWEEEQAFKVKTKGGDEIVDIVKVKRKVPTDTKAALAWLTNRQRHLWKDSGAQSIADGVLSLAELVMGAHKMREVEGGKNPIVDVTPANTVAASDEEGADHLA